MSLPLEESFGIIPIKHIARSPFTRDNTMVLLILQKTISPQHRASYWTCPKGHAEPDDAGPIDSAIRELREETGLLVKPSNILSHAGPYQESYNNPTTNGKKTVTYFAGIVSIDGDGNHLELQEKEVESAVWLTWDEAIEKVAFEDMKNLLRGAMVDVFNVRGENMDL